MIIIMHTFKLWIHTINFLFTGFGEKGATGNTKTLYYVISHITITKIIIIILHRYHCYYVLICHKYYSLCHAALFNVYKCLALLLIIIRLHFLMSCLYNVVV